MSVSVDSPVGLTDPAATHLARVVLVDNRPERLRVMRTLLDCTHLLTVVGEASTTEGAIAEVTRTGADIVVVEIQLPVEQGISTLAALRQHFPLVHLIVCSFHQDAATRKRADDSGADAYIDKPVDRIALAALLRGFAARGGWDAPPATGC